MLEEPTLADESVSSKGSEVDLCRSRAGGGWIGSGAGGGGAEGGSLVALEHARNGGGAAGGLIVVGDTDAGEDERGEGSTRCGLFDLLDLRVVVGSGGGVGVDGQNAADGEVDNDWEGARRDTPARAS